MTVVPKRHRSAATTEPPARAGARAHRDARLSHGLLATLLLASLLGAAEAVAIEPALEGPGAEETEAEAVWRRLVPDTKDFSILLPGAPVLEVKRKRTVVGQVTEAKYLVEMDRGHVSIETHVLPRVAMLFAPARTVLARAKEQILKSRSAEEISYGDLADQPYRTTRLVYRPGGSDQPVEEVRMTLRKNRLYLLTAALPSSEASREIASRFFDSFRIGRSDPTDDAAPDAAEKP